MDGSDKDLEDKDEVLQEDDFITPQDLFVPGMQQYGSTKVEKKEKATSRGLMNTSKAVDGDSDDWDDDDEDSEEKKEKEMEKKVPFLTNTDYNIIMSVMNIIFGIVLVIMLNIGDDKSTEVLVVIIIGALATVASCCGLIWYLTCHIDSEVFQNAIFKYIEDKKESDPAFAKKMSRGYLVSEKRYIDDVNTYVAREVDKELVQEGVNVDELIVSDTEQGGGAEFLTDNEEIIEEEDSEDIKRTATPTGTRSDPTQPDSGVELTPIVKKSPEGQKRNPDPTQSTETPDTPSKGILSKGRKRNKSVTWSVSTADELVGNGQQEELKQLLDDVAEDEPVIVEVPRMKSLESESEMEEEEEVKDDEYERIKFYDQLFLTKLKPNFRKYRNGLETSVPNPAALANMDEADLAAVISSKPMRKRILKEARGLLEQLKQEKASRTTESDDEDYGDEFLDMPPDQDSEEDVISVRV